MKKLLIGLIALIVVGALILGIVFSPRFTLPGTTSGNLQKNTQEICGRYYRFEYYEGHSPFDKGEEKVKFTNWLTLNKDGTFIIEFQSEDYQGIHQWIYKGEYEIDGSKITFYPKVYSEDERITKNVWTDISRWGPVRAEGRIEENRIYMTYLPSGWLNYALAPGVGPWRKAEQ